MNISDYTPVPQTENDATRILSFPCISGYSEILGYLEYIGSLIYLIPAFLLHIFILKSIFFTENRHFKGISFFQIYITDCLASIILIFSDIIFGRVFLFITPLCPIVIPYFAEPSWILKFDYYIVIHMRYCKCLTQIFLVLNRMSCITFPQDYSQIWKKATIPSIIIIFALPFANTWNIMISRTYAWPLYGGFIVNYIKKVQWAANSMFQSIYILTALGITVVCTFIMMYKLIYLADRIKSAEKSLCITGFYISVTFVFVAVTQILYATCTICRAHPILFILQMLAFDGFTVGSAYIMILTNPILKEMLLKSWRKAKISSNNMVVAPISNSNLST